MFTTFPSISATNGFRKKLSSELDSLSCQQELQFWCVYALRCLPFFNSDFIRYVEPSSYISALISKIILLYSNKNESEIDTMRVMKLTSIMSSMIDVYDFKLYPPVYGVRPCLIDLGNDLYIDSYIRFETSITELRERLIVYTPNHSKKLRDIMLDDIDNIRNNKPFNNDYSIYGNQWNEFIHTLYATDCDFFADLLLQLFRDNFVVKSEYKESISNIPIEMFYHASREVSLYVKNLMLGSAKLNEARLIILGDKGSGKTSLARRIVDPLASMPRIEESTPGVNISCFKLCDICNNISEEDNANVRVWDFAGHTITHAAHRCFLSERCVYIVLCEGRKENVNSLNYWLELIRNYGGNSKIFILVNQHDNNIVKLDENRITRDYADNDCEFFYFSIKKDNKTALIDFRNRIADYIATSPAWSLNKIAQGWFNIKEKLEEKFGKSEIDFISIDDYYDIADSIGVNDRDEALAALTSLGVCLYYPQIDDLKTVVLDPEWITFGVYDIINWLVNQKKDYRISLDEFKSVFSKTASKYPLEKHKFLYNLMLHYELAYEESADMLVVPQCMQSDEPSMLPNFSGDYLQIRFEAKNIDGCQIPIPPDLMPRIIVKRCEEMKNSESFAWRYGAVLHTKNAVALIIQNGSVLNIKVEGIDSPNFFYELYQTILLVISNYESFQKNKSIFSILPFLNDGERGEVTPIQTLNNVTRNNQKLYINPQDNQLLDLSKMEKYYSPLLVINHPTFNGPTNISYEQNIQIYCDRNVELQGAINTILSKLPDTIDSVDIREDLNELAQSLGQNEQSTSPISDTKRNGLWLKMKHFGQNLPAYGAKLIQVLSKTKNSIALINELFEAYNALAEIIELPTIDSIF